MGRLFYLAAALAAAGCGKVGAAAAPPADAPFPDALTCTDPNQMVCGSACFDPLTSIAHCGDCDTSCGTRETCMAGHCVDTLVDCAAAHAMDATLVDGTYTFIDGNPVFCDMTDGGVTYEALAFGQYDVAVAGYELVTVADLQTVPLQKAFISLYNQQGGAKLIASWMSNNCCFKFDASVNELFFGSNFLTPYTTANVEDCSNGPYVDPLYRFGLVNVPAQTTHTVQPPPLAASFFTTNPANAVSQCTDQQNPGFFWMRHP